MAVLWPSILASVGSLGLADSFTHHAAKRLSVRAATIAKIIGVQTLILIPVGLALLPVLLADESPDVLRLTLLNLSFIPVYLAGSYAMSFVAGRGQLAAFQFLRGALFLVIVMGYSGALIAGQLTILSAVLIYLVAHAAQLGCSLLVLHRAGRSRDQGEVSVRRLLSFGVRSHAATLPSMANERLDQLVLTVLATPRVLGLYVVAVTLTAPIVLVGTSVAYVALPEVSAHCQACGRRTALRYAGTGLVVAALLAMCLAIFADTLIVLVFGASFAGAAAALPWLLLGSVFLAVNRVASACWKGLGLPGHASLAETIGLLLTVPGLLLVVPRYGFVGAAAVSAVAYGAALSANVILYAKTRRNSVARCSCPTGEPAKNGG